MIATRVALKASHCAVSTVALTAVALLLSGCTGFDNAIRSDTTPVGGAVIQGAVHGGQQPINGATIGLYVAGSTGYGSSESHGNLLTSPVSTAVDGTFTITGDYTCPSGTSLVYLTASGGDAGSGANSAIKLVAPLGQCGNLTPSTYVVINEVTTAATALALGQFFTPTFGISSADSIGTSSTNSVGLTNAFATVNNLVTIATGNAVTSATLTGSGGTVTTTPEYAKLYTIANVLAACVNSAGAAPCTTILFPSVTPTSATAPTDTFQAAVYMSQNPTSNNVSTSPANLTALYGLQSGSSPFVGVGAQPTDWTVGILYTSTGSTSASPLLKPQNIAADANGNIWVINANSSTADNLAELNPVGFPLVTAAPATKQYRDLAIDTNGNILFGTASSPATAYEYTSGGSLVSVTGPSSPYAVSVNGSNDIFYGRNSGSACSTSVAEFTADTFATTNLVEYACPSFTTGLFAYMAIDTSNNLWMTNAAGDGTYITEVTGVPSDATINSTCTTFPCTPSTTPAAPTLTYTQITAGGSVPTLGSPWGIAAGPGGVIWLANSAVPAVTKMTSASAGTNYGDSTSLTLPEYLAVDGTGNVWIADKNSSPGTVSEFSSTGTVLSPVNTGSGVFTTVGFSHTGLASGQGITLDPSGNVWVANNVLTTGGVFEIVGAGAPTDTPIAKSLADGKVGVKP